MCSTGQSWRQKKDDKGSQQQSAKEEEDEEEKKATAALEAADWLKQEEQEVDLSSGR